MSKTLNPWSIILLVLAVLSLMACNAAATSTPNSHGMEHNDDTAAHVGHIHAELPADYVNLTNPFPNDAAAVAAGKKIYEINCVICHGPQGQGDGLSAVGLNPKPASLADKTMMGGLSDAYLFWRISEGGAMAPFNSAMPTWKATFSVEERWQLVNYVRTLGQ